jgi:hypothetical protein
MPFVVALVDKGSALIVGEIGHHLEPLWIACDQSSALKQRGVLGQAIGLTEGAGIDGILLLGDALYESVSWFACVVVVCKAKECRDFGKLTFSGFSTMLSATEARRAAASARSGSW